MLTELNGISATLGNLFLTATKSSYWDKNFKIAVSEASPITRPPDLTIAVLHKAPHSFKALKAEKMLRLITVIACISEYFEEDKQILKIYLTMTILYDV